MPKFIIERSDSEDYTAHAGLVLAGLLINQHTDLVRTLNRLPGAPSVSHADVVRTYLGLLLRGKTDFEAVDGMRGDDFARASLDIKKVPSKETLRQRFDRNAGAFAPLVRAASVEVLKRAQAPITPLPTGHVALNIDGFAMDNSNTKKEGVSRTYRNFDGYIAMPAYLGEEGWCLQLRLLEGSRHTQNGFVAFLDEAVLQARELTKRVLLVLLDSAHDALENLAALHGHKQTSYIVKWNPRKADLWAWRNRVFAEGRVVETRPGKRVGVMSVRETREFKGKAYRLRRVVRVTERTIDRRGQMLTVPDIELEGWWTDLRRAEQEVINLYATRGTSEQYHAEIKSDMGVERLPSGKFATNDLIMAAAGLAYNVLRIMGQKGLLGPDSPVRRPATRRRLRTVMQELMTVAARLVRTARQLRLRFGRHCPAYDAFVRLHASLSPS